MCIVLVVRDTEETSQPDLKLWVEDRQTNGQKASCPHTIVTDVDTVCPKVSPMKYSISTVVMKRRRKRVR